MLPLVGLQRLCLQLQVFVEEAQHDQSIRVSLDPLWVKNTKTTNQPTMLTLNQTTLLKVILKALITFLPIDRLIELSPTSLH